MNLDFNTIELGKRRRGIVKQKDQLDKRTEDQVSELNQLKLKEQSLYKQCEILGKHREELDKEYEDLIRNLKELN